MTFHAILPFPVCGIVRGNFKILAQRECRNVPYCQEAIASRQAEEAAAAAALAPAAP